MPSAASSTANDRTKPRHALSCRALLSLEPAQEQSEVVAGSSEHDMPTIVKACGGNRALIGRSAGWPNWRVCGAVHAALSFPSLKATINLEYLRL